MFRFAHLAFVAVLALVIFGTGAVQKAEAAYTEPIYMNIYPVNASFVKNFNITINTQFYIEFVMTDFNGNGITGLNTSWFTVNKWQDTAQNTRTYTSGTVTEVGGGVYRMPFTATQSPASGSMLFGQFRFEDGGNLRLEGSAIVGVGSAPTSIPTQFDGAPEFTCYQTGSAGTMTVTVALKDGNNNPFTGASYDSTGNGGSTNQFYVKELIYYTNRNTKVTPTSHSGVNNGDGTYTITINYPSVGTAGTWMVSFEYYTGNAGNNKMKFPVGVQFSANCTGAPATVPPNPNAPELNPCSATAPTDLAAGTLTPTSVPLSWSADCANSDTYTVYRDGAPLAAGTNLTCSAGTMNFTDATVSANTSYAYTVRGHNNGEGCDSGDSNTVNVTTPSCTESVQSSIIWNGTGTANGDFSGASFANLTDVSNVEYKVTSGSGTGTCQVSNTGSYYISALEYSTFGDNFTNSGTYLTNNTNDVSLPPTGTPLGYDIDFQQAGTYYLWVLGRQSGLSIWYGLDGSVTGNTEFDSNADWIWRSAFFNTGPDPIQINVPSAGVHTLNIWGRETGSEIAGIIITADAGFNATGGGSGGQQHRRSLIDHHSG